MLAEGAFGYWGDYLVWWVLLLSLLFHTWCFFRLFPRERHRRAGLILGNGMVFLCLLGVAAIIGESYYRFVAVETDSFGMSLPARRWFALYGKLNSVGCRDKEWSAKKPPEVQRIAFVGDSFTYGWGIEREDDRFSNRIEARLNQAGGTRFEVFNVAKPGWDSGAELMPIEDLVSRYGIDEVVLCYVANDVEKLLPTTPDFNPIHPPESEFLSPDASALWDYLFYRIFIRHEPSVRNYFGWLAAGFADPNIWRQHENQLGAMISTCRQQGTRFRVVILPFIRTGGDRFDAQTLYERVERFFERNGVDVLNLYPAIEGIDPESLTVNSHDAHPNERANRLFADAIWQAFYAGKSLDELVSKP